MDSLCAPCDVPEITESRDKVRTTLPPLTEKETEFALPVLNRREALTLFRHVDRRYADPEIPNQKITLISFTPSKTAKPDKDGIYGMMKVRGNFATEQEADERAEYLIRNTDSVHDIYHAYVGRPFPVTTKTGFERDLRTIDIRQKVRETISENVLERKKKEKEEIEELQQKEKELLAESERALKNEPRDPFEDYITHQVKRAQLVFTYVETKKKMDQMKQSYFTTQKWIEECEKEHPDYSDSYKERYMKARRDAGIPDDDSSFIQYLGLDCADVFSSVSSS